MHRVQYLLLLVLMAACAASPDAPVELTSAPTPVPETVSELMVEPILIDLADDRGLPVADLVSVAVTGEANNYTFAITISSADTGCEQYADWWEVVDTETGKLIYRRILNHSHVNEQPFIRSGGPVPITPEQTVLIRGHMGGVRKHYGGQAFGGSVETGFKPIVDSLPSLETVEPLPKGCAF